MKDLAAVEAFALQFQNRSRCKTLTAEAKKAAAGRESVLKSFTSLTEAQVSADMMSYGVVWCDVMSCHVIAAAFTLSHSHLPSCRLRTLFLLADEEESKRVERVS